MIPNTTPTPNELYNGQMRLMNGSELKLVMVITRATLGWELDHETGMRKKEDWKSQSQIIKETGLSGRAISTAIASCIKKGWIEARDKKGNLLNTTEKRAGNKIYYRLGKLFLDKLETSEESSEDTKPVNFFPKTCEESSPQPVKKVQATKEIHTKEIHTKEIAIQRIADTINPLINKFKEINPSYKKFFFNKSQRSALDRLVKEHGVDKVSAMIDSLPQIRDKRYAPVITTPCQLEDKLAALIGYFEKEKSRSPKIITIS